MSVQFSAIVQRQVGSSGYEGQRNCVHKHAIIYVLCGSDSLTFITECLGTSNQQKPNGQIV